MPTNIFFLAERQNLSFLGLGTILERHGFEYELVSEYEDVTGGIIVATIESVKLHPKLNPSDNIVLLCDKVNLEVLYYLTKYHMYGCITGDSDESYVIETFERALRGETHFSIFLIKKIYQMGDYEGINRFYQITQRELQILNLTILGQTNQTIADKLFISIRTVNAHKRKLLSKTKSPNMEYLVARIIELGLVNSN